MIYDKKEIEFVHMENCFYCENLCEKEKGLSCTRQLILYEGRIGIEHLFFCTAKCFINGMRENYYLEHVLNFCNMSKEFLDAFLNYLSFNQHNEVINLDKGKEGK